MISATKNYLKLDFSLFCPKLGYFLVLIFVSGVESENEGCKRKRERMMIEEGF